MDEFVVDDADDDDVDDVDDEWSRLVRVVKFELTDEDDDRLAT